MRSNKIKRHTSVLMYLISFNSGYFLFCQSVNYVYISGKLARPSSDYNLFLSYAAWAFSLKPIYGWISDTVYPFRYRLKFYVVLCSIVHILTCVYIFVKEEPSFD